MKWREERFFFLLFFLFSIAAGVFEGGVLCSFFVYLSRIRYKNKMPVLHVSAVVLSTAPTVFRTQASSSTTPCGGHGEGSVSQANPCIAFLGTHTPVDATRSPYVSSSWTSSNRVRR